MTAGEDRLRRTRQRWLVVSAAAAVAVLLVAGTATVVGRHLRSPAQLAANAAPPAPSLVTAAVERRVLAEPVVLRGKVLPGASVQLFPPNAAVGANSVVTKVPVKSGSVVREGEVLLERSGEPLLVLVLPFRLYRDITAGMKGPDVSEVQKALRRIGYHVSVTGEFDGQTQQAVKALYSARGYVAPTGEVTTPPGGPAPPSPVADPPVRLPQADVVVLDAATHKISAVDVHVGDVLSDPKAALFDLDQAAPTILAVAARDQAGLLRAGQAVTATDDAAGTQTQATVDSVGTQPVTTDGQTGYEVRMRFTGNPLSTDGQRLVRLSVQVTAGATPVLAVPVTAVSSRADGSTFVTVAEHDTTHDVSVTTGQIAGGWVELRDSGDKLAEGTLVVVGEHGVPHT